MIYIGGVAVLLCLCIGVVVICIAFKKAQNNIAYQPQWQHPGNMQIVHGVPQRISVQRQSTMNGGYR